ncbi:MAG: rhomboid family intramembrane serine protease [Pseudomonadota bacterium]
MEEETPQQKSAPAFNVPGVVLILVAVWLAIHGLERYVLSVDGAHWLVVRFSFIPVIYNMDWALLPLAGMPFWTPVSHAFLHGDWGHVGTNSLFFLIFGTIVARRFGWVRFLLFFALGAAAGALGYWLGQGEPSIPMIGASGAISACLGASLRFAFHGRIGNPDNHLSPRLTLAQTLTSARTLPFLLIWLATSAIFDSGVVAQAGDAGIAWQAHLGGFLFGIVAFAPFDPLGRFQPARQFP